MTLWVFIYINKNISTAPGASSNAKIDIVIPVVEKDFLTLSLVIDSAREYLNHLIGKIFIIAPCIKEIENLCFEKNCQFIWEDSMLPLTKKDIDYNVRGEDRSGWLFQQLLKMEADSLALEPYYLVLDADTILIKPQIFEANGKAILLHSDEHHQPYFVAFEKLFGNKAETDLSFVCHQMMIEKRKMSEMKRDIEERNQGKRWFEAIIDIIDRFEGSSVSEYELYGQWMLQHYPERIIREYWFNIALSDKNLKNLNKLKKKLGQKYRSISFHSYLSKRA